MIYGEELVALSDWCQVNKCVFNMHIHPDERSALIELLWEREADDTTYKASLRIDYDEVALLHETETAKYLTDQLERLAMRYQTLIKNKPSDIVPEQLARVIAAVKTVPLSTFYAMSQTGRDKLEIRLAPVDYPSLPDAMAAGRARIEVVTLSIINGHLYFGQHDVTGYLRHA